MFPVDGVRAAVRYLRLKPDDSCRLAIFGARETEGTEPPDGFIVHLFADRDRARESFEKEQTRKHVATDRWQPFLDDEHAAVAVPYPNDPELPELRRLYEPDRFRRALAEVLPEFPESEWRIQRQLVRTTVLAYKPGRRAVFRIKVKLRHRDRDEKVRVILHAKLATDAFVDRALKNLTSIHEAARTLPDLQTAVPCGRSSERPFTAAHWVDGETLRAHLAGPGSDRVDALARTGAALAQLHGLDLPLEHNPSPVEEGERLFELADDLGALLREEHDRAQRIADALACGLSRLAVAPSSIVHGDFHPGQVLVQPQGVVLVDFDRAGRGYAAQDVGEFSALLDPTGANSQEVTAFLAGYAAHTDRPLVPDEVRVSQAVALFKSLTTPFRELRSDWTDCIRYRLERCEHLLKELLP